MSAFPHAVTREQRAQQVRAERDELVHRRGQAALVTRWKLTRNRWDKTRRTDIGLTGVEDCLPVLSL